MQRNALHRKLSCILNLFLSPWIRLDKKRKDLIEERNRLLKVKKENRVKMETESREESELAKVLLGRVLFSVHKNSSLPLLL